jgi:hypothetical protein
MQRARPPQLQHVDPRWPRQCHHAHVLGGARVGARRGEGGGAVRVPAVERVSPRGPGIHALVEFACRSSARSLSSLRGAASRIRVEAADTIRSAPSISTSPEDTASQKRWYCRGHAHPPLTWITADGTRSAARDNDASLTMSDSAQRFDPMPSRPAESALSSSTARS